MKTLIFLMLMATAAQAQSVWQPSAGHTQIALWPSAIPDAVRAAPAETLLNAGPKHLVAGRPWWFIRNVTKPTLTVYSPRGNNTGAAMLVFPGGGYEILAIDLEGTEICDWLTSKGITCVLVKYRVPDSGPHHHSYCKCELKPPHPLALEDAMRALRLVRHRATEWNIDPHRIGVIGFSAGGHVVADISNSYNQHVYKAVDDADKESARPDFAVGIYPGHLWIAELGKLGFNPDLHVTHNTPPTFLLQAQTDSIDNVNQSLAYYVALKDAGVPTEMHLFYNGGHAFGLRRTKDPITEWPDLVEKWLHTIGVLPKP